MSNVLGELGRTFFHSAITFCPMTTNTTTTQFLAQTLKNNTQDMTGKVVAITGTTSGTGFVLARELARLGAEVLLLNRDSERSSSALQRLSDQVPGGRFRAITCDLQSFASVRSAAAQIVNSYTHLDVLCNNAGVMALPDQATSDGYDVQMQTNAIAPFLLTKELLPLLKRSPEARVISHTSAARLGSDHSAKYFGKNGGKLGGDGTAEESAQFSGPRWERYHQSKLANCTFSYGLKERLAKAGITNIKVLIAHPGLAETGLQIRTASTGGMDLNGGFMSQAQSAEDGALGILRACADPAAESGDFYGPQGWAGPAEKLEPEGLLYAAANVQVLFTGCEDAVGPLAV